MFTAVFALVGVVSQSGLGVSAQIEYFPKPDNLAEESGDGCAAYKEVCPVQTFAAPIYGRAGNVS